MAGESKSGIDGSQTCIMLFTFLLSDFQVSLLFFPFVICFPDDKEELTSSRTSTLD